MYLDKDSLNLASSLSDSARDNDADSDAFAFSDNDSARCSEEAADSE